MEIYDEAQRLAPASTQYNEFIGTSAGDLSMTGPSIGEMLNLDPKEWSILGYELHTETMGSGVVAYAANLKELGVNSYEDWPKVVERLGHIPVVVMHLPDSLELQVFIRDLFKRSTVRFIGSGVANFPLAVAGKHYAPYGELAADE